ncbi:MAG: hypothetical protein QOC94_191 [Actinoplanes sp.]|nr:hypothetical protein [Actinoplanes sp.]
MASYGTSAGSVVELHNLYGVAAKASHLRQWAWWWRALRYDVGWGKPFAVITSRYQRALSFRVRCWVS